MNHTPLRSVFAVCCCLTLLGCNQNNSPAPKNASIDKTKFILNEEPDGAVGVLIAREDAKDNDDIVVVGRIGGRKNPWIDGHAAFMMIDAAMTVVPDGEDSKTGQVCMDDCCASLRSKCTTLVKIVDHQGKPLAIDTRELLNVKENDMIVVKGKVQRDKENGKFVVAATGVYIR